MEGACQLEPLNEEYEGEEDGVENSDDDGLQMMKVSLFFKSCIKVNFEG